MSGCKTQGKGQQTVRKDRKATVVNCIPIWLVYMMKLVCVETR